MRILHGSLLALALLFAATPSALGYQCIATQCSTQSFPFTTTSWSDTATFNKFDPDLGTLTDVSVRLTATIQGQVSFESLDDEQVTVDTWFSADVRVFRPGGFDTIISVTPHQVFTSTVPAFDGTIDFAGPSSDSFSIMSESATGTHISPSPMSDLALFTGVAGGGPAGTIVLPVLADGNSFALGPDNVILLVQQEASVEVELCYTYIKVGVCQADSIPSMPEFWTDSVTIERFDPDLGILTGVELTLSARSQGQVLYESLDAQPSVVLINYSSLITLFRPGATSPITTAAPLLQFAENASAHDGTIDFRGSSGQTITGIDISDSSAHFSPSPTSDLALFTGVGGTGSPGTITLPVTAAFTGAGAGNIVTQFQSTTSATVEVRYIFDEDCNYNGIPDSVDIAGGTSLDVNNDGAPDECDQFASICNGDGGDQLGCTNCPCMNNASPGTIGGCLNSAATSARLAVSGDASVSLIPGSIGDLRFSLIGATPFAFCILNSGDAVAPGGMANPCFGMNSGAQADAFDGLRCAILNTRRHGERGADANGEVGATNSPWGGEASPLAGIAQAGGGFVSGQTRFFQVITRDDPMASCMRGLNTSQAVRVTFTP